MCERAAFTVVAGLAAIGPASALAGGNQYPTFFTAFKYKLKNGEAKFKGQIDSTKGNCVGDRKVVLYRKKNGNKKKLGGDHTNNRGSSTSSSAAASRRAAPTSQWSTRRRSATTRARRTPACHGSRRS